MPTAATLSRGTPEKVTTPTEYVGGSPQSHIRAKRISFVDPADLELPPPTMLPTNKSLGRRMSMFGRDKRPDSTNSSTVSVLPCASLPYRS